jgi:hypothetical protein
MKNLRVLAIAEDREMISQKASSCKAEQAAASHKFIKIADSTTEPLNGAPVHTHTE